MSFKHFWHVEFPEPFRKKKKKKDIKVIFKTMDCLYLLLKVYLQSEVYHLYELLLLQLFWLHRCYYPQEYADFQHLQQC